MPIGGSTLAAARNLGGRPVLNIPAPNARGRLIFAGGSLLADCRVAALPPRRDSWYKIHNWVRLAVDRDPWRSTLRGGLMKARIAALLFVVQFAAGACGAQTTDDAQKCAESATASPNLALQSCTAAIQAGKLSPANLATTYNNRGDAYIVKGDYDHAIQDFDQAIQLMPDYALAFKNRGIAHGTKGDYDLAIEDFGQAILLKPDDASAFNSRGIAYGTKGDYVRAIQNFNQAIQLQPGYADAFNNRGSAYDDQGDFDHAIPDFDQAIRLNPGYALAFKNRGIAYYLKHDYDRAIQDYDQAIRFTPADPALFQRRASVYWGKEDYARALQDFDQAVRLNPKASATFRGRGITHFYLGQFEAARQDIALAVKLDPTDPYAALWLYLTEAKLGQDAKADLAKIARGLKSMAWPCAVIQLYLGAASSREVMDSAKDPNPRKNTYQQCEAYFYIGEDALLHGRPEEATQLFEKTIATGVTSFFEYHGATVELSRMKAAQR
jgi:lipoprotein NlpI